jgi:hypothetical protein
MIEIGTRQEFKDCVLDQVWVWVLRCGHKVVTDPDFRTEFSRLDRREIRCPYCELEQKDARGLPENHNVTRDMLLHAINRRV